MDNLQLSQGGSFALNSGALANAAGNVNITNGATINYTVDGVFYSRTTVASQSIAMSLTPVFSRPSNGAVTGAAVGGSTFLIGVYLDAAGNFSFFPGPAVNSADLANGNAPLQFPPPIKGKCCVGVVRIGLTAGTTFIPGTTALNAAGVTTTYLNLFAIPGEPLRS